MEKRRGVWNYINKFQLKYQFVTAVLHTTKVTSMKEIDREAKGGNKPDMLRKKGGDRTIMTSTV